MSVPDRHVHYLTSMSIFIQQWPLSNTESIIDMRIIEDIPYRRQISATVLVIDILDLVDLSDILGIVGTFDIGGK